MPGNDGMPVKSPSTSLLTCQRIGCVIATPPATSQRFVFSCGLTMQTGSMLFTSTRA